MQTFQQKFVIYTLTGSAGILTLLYGYKEIRKALKSEKAKGLKLSTSKYVRWASRLYTALHDDRWGFPNEDEEAIYKVATEMCGQTDFDNVARAYKREFSEDLFTKLTSLLSSKEYNIFLNKLDICD